MNQFQKWVFHFLSLLALVVAVVLVIQNWGTPVAIAFGQAQSIDLPLGGLLLGVFALGFLTVFFRIWDLSQQMRLQLKHAELRKEKAEVKAETNVDQIRALESKVQTLEKALEQALSSGGKGAGRG